MESDTEQTATSCRRRRPHRRSSYRNTFKYAKGTKVNSGCVNGVTVGRETIGLLQENAGSKLSGVRLGNAVLDVAPRAGAARDETEGPSRHGEAPAAKEPPAGDGRPQGGDVRGRPACRGRAERARTASAPAPEHPPEAQAAPRRRSSKEHVHMAHGHGERRPTALRIGERRTRITARRGAGRPSSKTKRGAGARRREPRTLLVATRRGARGLPRPRAGRPCGRRPPFRVRSRKRKQANEQTHR